MGWAVAFGLFLEGALRFLDCVLHGYIIFVDIHLRFFVV